MSFAFAFRCLYMSLCQIFVIFAYGSKRVSYYVAWHCDHEIVVDLTDGI